jgi:TonB family protein
MGYLGPSLRRERRRERPVHRIAAAAAVSLALNVLALWALAVAGAFKLSGAGVDPTRVALTPMSAAQWEANRAVAPPKSPPSSPEDERASGAVVELSPQQQASETPPEKAKFLSDRNTRVDKETVSRHAGNYPRVAPRPEQGSEGAPRDAPRAGGAAQGKGKEIPGREGTRGERVAVARPRAGPGAELGELRIPELGEGGEGGRRRAGEPGADLSLSPEALARIAGGPSMDGVGEGLEVGDETWLQSREFKYATYINRMRSEIGQAWYPRVRDAVRERDPDGSLYLYKERTVVLGLTIDTGGNVKDLAVIRSSSIDFFDRVAAASVRAAQPFPNPPRGMFRADDEVRIPFFFTMYPRGGQALFWRPPEP